MKASPDVYAIIGGAFLLSAVVAFYNTRKFISQSANILGEIIYEGVKNTSDIKAVMFVKIEFMVNNKKYIIESTVSRFQKLKVGGFVEMLYSKSNPNNAKINSFIQLYLFELILLFFGLSFLIGFFANKQ